MFLKVSILPIISGGTIPTDLGFRYYAIDRGKNVGRHKYQWFVVFPCGSLVAVQVTCQHYKQRYAYTENILQRSLYEQAKVVERYTHQRSMKYKEVSCNNEEYCYDTYQVESTDTGG